MKKNILAITAAALTIALTACSGSSKNALVIEKQGVFTSGGTVTAPVPGEYAPEKSWLDPTRAGNTAHIDHANTFYQIPAGSEAQNQFFRQMTPNTGDYDEKLFGSVLSDVLADVRKMTEKKAIYITHSQGGRVGWQTDTENLAAIVAVEPGGTPIVGSEEYNKFLNAKIPMIIYFGDYIDNGPENIMSTGFLKQVRDMALDFAEHYNADGGDATVIDLPKIGITGNSHFLFQETNNALIAEHLERWLKKHGLTK